MAESRILLRRRKSLKMPQNPQRRVPAVWGGMIVPEIHIFLRSTSYRVSTIPEPFHECVSISRNETGGLPQILAYLPLRQLGQSSSVVHQRDHEAAGHSRACDCRESGYLCQWFDVSV